jgi:glycosyltransferase involved in cell wall biosynthesis
MARALIVSFRLGGTDGVSIEAAKWSWAMEELGFSIETLAGAGTADTIVAGLAIGERGIVDVKLPLADVVIVENLLSLAPLNPDAAHAVARALKGRPAVLHHHDLPWQRPQFADWSEPVPDDAAWRHVTINELSRAELAERGIGATTIYNAFDPEPPAGDRDATRAALAVGDGETLLLHPTRAIPRKNVAAALALAAAMPATYWLLGGAEDGYDDELARLLAAAPVRVIQGGAGIADAYAAADAVCLPSTWEGFGNPTIESALYRKPLAVGDYPVARELEAFGFRWFDAGDAAGLAAFVAAPDASLLDHNADLARCHFNLRDLPAKLAAVLP